MFIFFALTSTMLFVALCAFATLMERKLVDHLLLQHENHRPYKVGVYSFNHRPYKACMSLFF